MSSAQRAFNSMQAGVQGWVAGVPAEATQDGKGGAAQCQLPLLPVTLIDEALSCTIKQLWRVICKPDPAFQATIHRLSGNRDIQYGDWQQQGGSIVREEQYINPLKKNSFGPTEALCIDRQQCTHRSAVGFVVERRVYTPKVPFGGSFYNLVQWCAWTEERSGKVRLQVSCDVVYTKRWVPAKGIINSSSIESCRGVIAAKRLLVDMRSFFAFATFGGGDMSAPSLKGHDSFLQDVVAAASSPPAAAQHPKSFCGNPLPTRAPSKTP